MIGKSDPYAIISHGNQKFKTNTVKNTQNPKWNYDADINVPDQNDDRIKVDIFDSDRIGKDKPLGSAYFDVDEVISKGIIPPAWYPLKGAKSGAVLMSADFEELGGGRIGSPEVGVADSRPGLDNIGRMGSRDRIGDKPSIVGVTRPDNEEGVLHLEVVGARNLVKSDIIGKSDPYAVVGLGDQKQKTDTAKNTQNPEWNCGMDFTIDKNTPDELKVQVFDKDKIGKDKSLGTTSLPVQDLIYETDPNMNRWLPLDGVKSGEILVASTFSPFDESSDYERLSGRGKGRQSAGDRGNKSSTISVPGDDDFDGKNGNRRGSRGLQGRDSSASLFDDDDRDGRRPSKGGAKGTKALLGRDANADARKKSSDSALGDGSNIPPGNVKVSIKQAKNLVKGDLIGKSDPYAIISCGNDASKTKTVKNDLNPVWNHEALFPVDNSTPRNIKIKVLDADRFGKDTPLGNVNIDIEDVAANGPLQDQWLPLGNTKSGEIQVSVEFDPDYDTCDDINEGDRNLARPGRSSQDDYGDRKPSSGNTKSPSDKLRAAGYNEDLIPGVIQLDLIQAKDLVKSDIIGKSDPFAVIQFDNNKIKTPVVKNNQNPEWNFETDIPIDENGPRNIKIDIFDSDKLGKDKSLGSANIPVVNIIHGNNYDKDWLPLAGTKSGKVQVSTNFIPEGEGLSNSNRRPSRGGANRARDDVRGRRGESDDDGDYASSPNSRRPSEVGPDGRKGSSSSRKPSDLVTGNPEIPAGNLHVNIKEAKDLIKSDMIGKSDPYAVLTYGNNKLKTHPVKNDQNPSWNFEGDIPIEEGGPGVIKLEVFDADKFGKDKSLGITSLDVMDIVENSPIDDTWVPLDGVKSGKVKLSADFTPEGELPALGSGRKGSSNILDPRRGSKISATDEARVGSRKASGITDVSDALIPGPGVVHVNVKKGKDLVKADMIGKSDPYVAITHDGNKTKSKVVKNNQNPDWNFEVNIPVDSQSPNTVKIEVLDSDRFGKDKPLGMADIDIGDLANNNPLQDAWIPLRGTKSGHIQVCADYTPQDDFDSGRSPKERGDGQPTRGPGDADDDGRKQSGLDGRRPSSRDGLSPRRGSKLSGPTGRPTSSEEIPTGNIHLEITQAKDLVKKDIIGKSDPYALVTYGDDKIKTKTIKNNQNPQWNFEADIPVHPDGPDNIRIDIFDEDKYGKDKPLGSADIAVFDIVNQGSLPDHWIPLDGVKSGKLQLSADFVAEDPSDSRKSSSSAVPYGQDGRKPMQKQSSRDRFISPDRKTSGGYSSSDRKPSGGYGSNDQRPSRGYGSPERRASGGRKASDPNQALMPGNLHLNIIQGKDLIKGDLIGKSDPYAVVTYGNDKVKTKAVKNNQNPEWNFEVDIPVQPNGPDFMKIEVFDQDKLGKDKSLGATNIDIPSLQHSESLTNIWVPLDNVKSGQIQLSADFSPSNKPYSPDTGSRKGSRDLVGSPGSRKGSKGGASNVINMLSGRKPSNESPDFDSGSLGDPRHGSGPDDKLGTIRLDLLCAKDLMKTDMIGKSDPYAVIQYGESKFETPVKNNTLNPDFNIQCNIDIPNNPRDRNIIITLYDSDKFGKDKCIGTTNIDIAKVMNLGNLKEDWVPLQGAKSGELRVGADFIPDTSGEPHIHQTFVEERRSSTQFHEVSLNRIPLPSSGGIIEASIRRPSGIVDKPLVDDSNTGTVAIKYQPSEGGLHYLDVNYNGDQVQGSPFKFHVNQQNSGQAFGYGPGLTHGVCGEPARFDISTKGAGAGGLSLAVEGPSKAEINCVDNKDGTVSVSYLPTAPGEYKIIAKFADKHIPGSPFTCKVTGDNKKKNQISVGSSSELQLPGDLSESDIRSLKAFIESPSGGIEQCFLKKLPKGNIGISFTPREVGEHLVSVQKNGKHITNSPFKIVVNSQEVGDASRVRVSGDGLEKGKTNIYNKFQINTKSAGYGGLSLSIEGPSKAEIECKDNEDGTLDVEYRPTEPGFYIINIKFADSHVPGSPFQVPISGEGTAKQTETQKHMREAVAATEVGSQCRLTFKMPGIEIRDLEALVSSPSGKTTRANVTELEESLFAVNFVPYELGVHTVTVRYRELDIPGSPFQFTVGPLMDSGSHRVHAGQYF